MNSSRLLSLSSLVVRKSGFAVQDLIIGGLPFRGLIHRKLQAHIFPYFLDLLLSFSSLSLRTFFTIFCSSIKNARTTLSFTQLPHRDPPYARWTVFFGLEIWEYSRGRRAGTCTATRQL